MKKYIAPFAEEIRFFTCDVLGPSIVLGDEEVSSGGKDEVTDILPITIFDNP